MVLSRTALWTIPVSDRGGVARHAVDVVGQGVPGWDLAFLCPPGPLVYELRSRGARVLDAPFGPDHGVLRSLRSLRGALAAVRPGVLHSHLSYADVIAAAGKPRRGVRLVTTEHGIAADDLVYHRSNRQAQAMARVHRQRFRRVDAVIAVSDATAAAMRAKWRVAGRIRVIRNGVDPRADNPASRPGLRVLSLARLAPEKRIPELLRGFAMVAQDHPEATLTVAGVGELDSALRAESRNLGIEDRVVFPGFVESGPAFAAADVVAMLSVWENCSYTLLDAASAGLGVVASPVGGNREMLPERCLVDPARSGDVATALLHQGLTPRERPGLRDWPCVEEMCAAIGAVYDDGPRP